jgi:hypothetical protein
MINALQTILPAMPTLPARAAARRQSGILPAADVIHRSLESRPGQGVKFSFRFDFPGCLNCVRIMVDGRNGHTVPYLKARKEAEGCYMPNWIVELVHALTGMVNWVLFGVQG